MKYTLFIFLMFGPLLGNAQVTSGKITYETKRDMHRNIPPERAFLKDRIPEFRTSTHILLFDGDEAFYKREKLSEQDQARRRERIGDRPGGRGRGMRFGGGGSSQVYRDLSENISLESADLFGKQFLIEGAPQSYVWKITGETKMVGDYLCQQAVYQDSMTNIMVWFSPMIPVSAGPGQLGGLPGMILYADYDDGERVVVAQDIEPRPISDDEIVRPTEGEPISREDFDLLRREKLEEMRQEYGGRDGGFRMGRGGR